METMGLRGLTGLISEALFCPNPPLMPSFLKASHSLPTQQES